MIAAVRNNWLEDIHLLAQAGLSINSREVSPHPYRGSAGNRTAFGDTLLILAARHSNLAMLKVLLDCPDTAESCDMNAQGYDGMTALMWAAHNNCVEIVDLLLRRHVRMNMQSHQGYTALMLAVDKGSLDAAYVLIRDFHTEVDMGHAVCCQL